MTTINGKSVEESLTDMREVGATLRAAGEVSLEARHRAADLLEQLADLIGRYMRPAPPSGAGPGMVRAGALLHGATGALQSIRRATAGAKPRP